MNLPVPVLAGEREIICKYGKVVLERQFRYPDQAKDLDFLVWGGTTVPSIILPVTKEGEVVAVRQFRHAANQFILEIPGGCPAPGESVEETVSRELLAETGYRTGQVILLGELAWFEPSACITPYTPVLATGCEKIQDLDLDRTEILGVEVFPLAEWIEMIHRGVVRDSKSITVTFLALPHLGLEVKRRTHE